MGKIIEKLVGKKLRTERKFAEMKEKWLKIKE